MPAQHKRPGRAARINRRERAQAREALRAEQRRFRDNIKVFHWWQTTDTDNISPGRLKAWGDGGGI